MGLENGFHRWSFENVEAKGGQIVKIQDKRAYTDYINTYGG